MLFKILHIEYDSFKISPKLLPLQRNPCNRPKINFVRIRRGQFSLTYLVIEWEKLLNVECVRVCVCVRASVTSIFSAITTRN